MIRKQSMRTTATLELFSPDRSLLGQPSDPKAHRLSMSSVFQPSDQASANPLEPCEMQKSSSKFEVQPCTQCSQRTGDIFLVHRGAATRSNTAHVTTKQPEICQEDGYSASASDSIASEENYTKQSACPQHDSESLGAPGYNMLVKTTAQTGSNLP